MSYAMRCDGCGRFDPIDVGDVDAGDLPRGWVTLNVSTNRRPYDSKPIKGTPSHVCSAACGEQVVRKVLAVYRQALTDEANRRVEVPSGKRGLHEPEHPMPVDVVDPGEAA